MELPDFVSLSGFDKDHRMELAVVKMNVAKRAQKITHRFGDIDELDIHVKDVHANKYEVHLKVFKAGYKFSTKTVDPSIHIALDKLFDLVEVDMQNHLLKA